MPEETKIGGMSTGELEFANWWVRNHITVRRLGYGALIAVSVLLWGYVAWGIVDAYAISYPREARLTHDIAINQQLLAALETDRPQNVGSSDVSVYPSTAGRYDMEVTLTNPNVQWWAEFDYRFNFGGEETPLHSGYVLPHSTQVVTQLGYKPSTAGGNGAAFEVENVRWHRVDPSFVGKDYDAFAKNRLQLAFNNITYDTDITVGSKKVGQTSFELDNLGAYGYWGVDLLIRLLRNDGTLAIQQIKVTNLSPGEKRQMQVVWPSNPAGVTDTQITPQVNLLDPQAYLPTQYFK